MSHPARLSLRAPPHLPFIQGFPGIPPSSSRKSAGVHGTLELRVGNVPVKAKWVRVELRKHECLPPGFPSPSSGSSSSGPETTWEHVGSIQTLWNPAEGKEWDTVETADFKFFLPLPETIPPSIELPKNTGVRYELVAALCYKQKGGLFKKESSAIIKVSEQLRITKHELHSAWPIYNVPDSRTIQAANGSINLTVLRPNRAFAAGDRIQFTAAIKSARPQPFKLKGFECTLYEVITSIPIPPELTSPKASKSKKNPPAPVSKARPVASVRAPVDENVGLGGEKSARIEMLVERALVSVKGARTLEVAYELEVKVVTEGLKEKVEMGGVRYIVGPFMRSHAQQAVRDIGHVDALCPGIPNSTASSPGMFPTSNPVTPPLGQRTNGIVPRESYPNNNAGYPPQSQYQPQIIQGFVPRTERRQSFATTATTDTTTTATHEFGGAGGGPQRSLSGRGYNTMPNQRRDVAAFPSPNPSRPRSTETTPASPVDSLQERFTQSEIGHGSGVEDYNKRYSTGTSATFGRWDKGLRSAMEPGAGGADGHSTLTSLAESDVTAGPVSPNRGGASRLAGPPSSFTYLTAEQEKRRQQELYESARARAAQVQEASGASLDRIGLQGKNKNGNEDSEPPPPEYAPPRPAQPDKAYTAPSRPVSTYTSGNAGSPDTAAAGNGEQDPPHTGLTTTMPTSSVPTKSTSGLEKTYMSAAEEKEIQRRRFEEATGRVVSASGSGQNVISSAQNSPAHRTTSRVASLSSAPGTPTANYTSTVPQESPIPYDAIFPTSASANGAGPSTSNGRQTVPPPATPVAALSEKEQMRRYYEAQDRVAAASQRGGGGSVDDHGAGPSSALAGPSTSTTTSAMNSPNRVGSAMGAVNEKEQMRRYYEAQERVAQAAASPQGSPIASGSGTTSSPRHQSFVPQQQTHSRSTSTAMGPGEGRSGSGSRPVGAVLSAVDEKEQMKRYYEAMERVQRAAEGGGGESSHSQSRSQSRATSPAAALAPPLETNNGEGPSSSSALVPPLSGNTKPTPTGYMSAEEEKDLMKKRFEAATNAVERANRSPPPFESHYERGDSTPTPSHTLTPAPRDGQHSHSRNASMAISESDSPIVRDPEVRAGKARARTSTSGGGGGGGIGFEGDEEVAGGGGAPPPPLPARPPMEYINLLSPVSGRGE
ncbi:hypothetical protein CI109_103979 [Kwoniella shandongensis]|uniref:Arrestin C-terminal-like domain-containing protein n=1 Tax=Kwoniella shandongensis TaxID=1734106 RepID=A0A5M6BXK9_9TREE|nr:uncharacterized protein CI109_004137 [Kwoniella shandongensis]KAA5527598.1 hypothetical protein CI109_004137 [Kwoniella shandongensis]